MYCPRQQLLVYLLLSVFDSPLRQPPHVELGELWWSPSNRRDQADHNKQPQPHFFQNRLRSASFVNGICAGNMGFCLQGPSLSWRAEAGARVTYNTTKWPAFPLRSSCFLLSVPLVSLVAAIFWLFPQF